MACLWVVEVFAPGEHTVSHPLRSTLPGGGRFTNRRNQASSCRTLQREQPSRSAMRCWLRPERRNRRARSRSVSRIHASRRTGTSSRARAQAARQVVVIGGNAVVISQGAAPAPGVEWVRELGLPRSPSLLLCQDPEPGIASPGGRPPLSSRGRCAGSLRLDHSIPPSTPTRACV